MIINVYLCNKLHGMIIYIYIYMVLGVKSISYKCIYTRIFRHSYDLNSVKIEGVDS